MELSSTHIRCSVHIDLCALERNFGRLKDALKTSQRYIALVSADAFGFGIEAAVVRLMMSGADAFAVTNLTEGRNVRALGSGWPVIVMGSSLPGEEEFYFYSDLRPTLVGCEEIDRFEAAAERLGAKLKVHMRAPVCDENQNIPNADEAFKMLDRLCASKCLELEALCLHGMGSGAPTESAVPDYAFLAKAAEFLKDKNKSVFIHHSDIFNPQGVPEYFRTCFRAGLVLFGIAPKEGSILGSFKPEQAMTFRGAVSQIKYLPKGATVGYGNTYVLRRTSRVALLSIGYGDGLRRSAGKNGRVLVRGKNVPIIGIVSMDQASIDATDVDGISVGDEVILIGSQDGAEITIEDYCAHMGISPAEALTSITKRVPRYYKTLY